jgi:hypothetical protein
MSNSRSQSWCSDRWYRSPTRAAVVPPFGEVRRAALGVWAVARALVPATLALLSAGCREDAMGPAENLPPRISFPPNALYRFTTWQVDEYGGKIQGSERSRRWVVLSTGAETLGYSDVTLVGDSSEHGATMLAFRFTPQGDIYQYGYLADLVQRLEGRTIAPRWDLIVTYSKGWSGAWTVGILDSGGTEKMTGSSSDEELFFTATVNGASTIVAGYPVVLSSRSMEAVLWVSENPAAFMRLREERFPPLTGRPGALREVTVINVP